MTKCFFPSKVIEDIKMKQKIESILEETGHSNTRAAKMDLNDILKHVSFSMLLHPVHLIICSQTAVGFP